MNEHWVVIGDIHGRFDLLMDLLKQIEQSRYVGWRLVFLGDMIDRGDDSYLVMEKVIELCKKGALAVLGNHEDMLLNWMFNNGYDEEILWKRNGGNKTQRSYERHLKKYGNDGFRKAFEACGHEKWLRSLPLHHETDEVWFSHAPIPKQKYNGQLLYRTDRYTRIWSWHGHAGVDEAEFARDHKKLAVCGHVHGLFEGVMVPRVYSHIIYADTGSGCHPSAPLSAVVLEHGKHIDTLQAWPGGVIHSILPR